jgi:hypothetical protein
VDAKPSSPKPGVKSWREAPRIERVAGLVFFGSFWVLALVMGSGSRAGVLGVVAWGLALAIGAPMAFSDAATVWRVCRWPTLLLVAAGFVLQVVGGS